MGLVVNHIAGHDQAEGRYVNHAGQLGVCGSDRDHGRDLVSDGDARAGQGCWDDGRVRQLAGEECAPHLHIPG